MAQRGRKSAASLSVVLQESPVGSQRLMPDASLGEAEKAVWVMVVNDQPADAFTDVHGSLLGLYCGHVIRARILNDHILKFDPELLSKDDGLKRYDKLLSMAERESRAASSLATRLRITRQAVDQQTIARAQLNAPKSGRPWETE